jgi:hypothetical protein
MYYNRNTMTDDGGEEIVTFRLAPNDRAAIQRLVEKGEFRNRSDFLRYAVKTTLRDHAPPPSAPAPTAPKLDLELEGVQLPDAGASAGKRATRAPGRISRGRSP